MTISMDSSGSFDKTFRFLDRMAKINPLQEMDSCGREGVAALRAATPVDSGLAASSWDYTVSNTGGLFTISWTNHDIENGFPVAIRLQYGYGTGTGGYVAGRDYINPAIRPIFDKIAEKVWRAVTAA